MDVTRCFEILQRHSDAQPREHADWARCCGGAGGDQVMDGYGVAAGEAPQAAPESNKPLPTGQIINIETGTNESLHGLEDPEALFNDFPEFQELRGPVEQAGAAEEPESVLAASLKELGTVALIEGVILQHSFRVAGYKAYNTVFKRILERGPSVVGIVYPQVVAAATRRFSTISQHVRLTAAVLAERGPDEKEIARTIRRLQTLEKEKLAVVAASHLERVRFLVRPCGPDPGPGLAATEVSDLRKKMGDIDTDIEELVSELKHSLAEQREDAAEVES